jgi:hypothetical protein
MLNKKTKSLGLVIAVTLLLSLMPGVALAGSPIGHPFPINTEGYDQVHSAVAYNTRDEQYMVVWHNEWPGNRDIYGQRLTVQGHPIGGRFLVAVDPGGDPGDRYLPDIAYNSDAHEYLVVWEHLSGSRPNIRAKLFNASGQAISGEKTLGTGAALRSRTRPAVAYAFTSDRYFVVWKSHVQGGVSDDIEAQVLFSSASPDGGNFFVDQGTWQESHDQPDVAYNRARNEVLLVWRLEDKNSGVRDIVGRRYKMAPPRGWAGTKPFPIASQSGAILQLVSNPAVAALPAPHHVGQYLVVWERLYLPGDSDILGQRIKGDDDSLVGLPGLSYIDISSISWEDTFQPEVAANERSHNYLVGWTLPVGAATAVVGRPVHRDGSLGAEAMFFEANADNVALAGGRGGDYLATWDAIFEPPTARDIFGQIWGNRVYLPIVLR